MNAKNRNRYDRLATWFFGINGWMGIAILLGIFAMLVYNTIAFFARVSPMDFITNTQWNPGAEGPKGLYGLLPLLISTLLVTFGAMLLAVPIGIGTAVFISEYTSPRVKNILKPAVEMLAAIPSVVIGFIGIVIIGPGIAGTFGLSNGLNAMNGAILLAMMALPTIITVAEDALHAVPADLKEASYGLGAGKWTTLYRVAIPAARPGIIAGVMLGMGRAIGETMTVLMATGNALSFPSGFFDSVRTITATIAIELGEVPHQTTHYYGLFALALVLFLITLAINSIADRISHRIRQYH
jgi:phosphate transport system permease protein